MMIFSMADKCDSSFQESIPALINFAQSKDVSTSVQLSSLQALTNLSTTSEYHAPYTQIIQHLYELLDDGEVKIQMQSLKLLVNLSLNPDMVPHLLAAKVSASVLSEGNTFVKWHVLSVVTNMRKFLKSEECLLLPAYEVFGMVMFSVVTVRLFTGAPM